MKPDLPIYIPTLKSDVMWMLPNGNCLETIERPEPAFEVWALLPLKYGH